MSRRADAGPESFGLLLRGYRGKRGLTQVELAERAGLHAQEISQLERGVVRRPRSTTVQFLADALKLDAQERATFIATARREHGPDGVAGQTSVSASPPDPAARLVDAEALLATLPSDGLPDRAPLPAGSRMPLAPNPLFVGRGDELLQVADALKGGDTVALGQVVASTGLGGLGKTQPAVELVHRYGRFFAGGVFWLSFASEDEIPLHVAACAGPDAMDLAPSIDTLPVDERVQRVQRAWQSPVPQLLIFDNCEEESLLEAWRPPSGGCRVLVTSRRSEWSPTLGVTALPLDLLPRADSIELLRRYRPDLAPDDPGLDALAAELGDLPLALHLAGSYLRVYRAEVGLDEYLVELRRAEVVQHASLLGAGLDDSPSPTHHVQSVAQTFALCLARLDRSREVDQVAIALLARMARMAPGEPVPRDLLAKTLDTADPRLRADGLRRLGAAGLVEEGAGWLRQHRLLAHFVRQEGLDPTAQPAVDRALIGRGEDADEGHLTRSAIALLPHLIHGAATAILESGNEERAADLANAAGQVLESAGILGGARPWYEHAVAIAGKVLGTGHPRTASYLNNLAIMTQAQGELAAARLQLALAIRERVLGPDHPDTAQGLNNLGLLLQAQGELDTARPLLQRSLTICEEALGPDHPHTAIGLSNLARLLHLQGESDTARPLLERALAIHEKVRGPDHPVTATGQFRLGDLLADRGELTIARPLLECSLAARERALGPDHPVTAKSLHRLALLLCDEGNPPATRPLFERALAIRERVLGPDHPDTVATKRALADLGAAGDGPAADE